MNAYISFLVLIFVLAAIAPQTMKRPWVLLLMCLVLCVTFYSARLFG